MWNWFILLPSLAASYTFQSSSEPTGDITSGAVFQIVLDKLDGAAQQTDSESVYITVQSGPGSLYGTIEFSQNGNSVTFSNLILYKTGTYNLMINASGYDSLSVGPYTVVHSTPETLSIETSINGGQYDEVCDSGVNIKSFDAAGNLCTGFTGTVDLHAAGPSYELLIQQAMTSGEVTINSCSIDGVGQWHLIASSAGLVSGTSNSFYTTNSNAVSSAEVVLSQQSIALGESFNVQVQLKDSNDIICNESNDTISLALSTGSLQNSYQVQATQGKVSFLNVIITDNNSASSLDVQAQLSSSTIGSATISIDPAGKLKIQVPDFLVSDGSYQQYSIRLTSKPYSEVKVTITSIVDIQNPVIFFSSSNYNEWQSIYFLPPQDETNESFTVDFTHALTSNDNNYDGAAVLESYYTVSSSTVTFNVYNQNDKNINYPFNVVTTEGTGYTITLQPTRNYSSDITIDISSSSPNLSLSENQLVINSSNYATGVQFTATPVENQNLDQPLQYVITYSVTTSDTAFNQWNTLPHKTNVLVIDNDSIQYVINWSYLSLQDGQTGSYTVALAFEPDQDVTVNIASSSAEVSVSPSTLNFTSVNYNTLQAVQITVNLTNDIDYINYQADITHTASSTGFYNGLQSITQVTVVNACDTGFYAYPSATDCDACPKGSQCSSGSITNCTTGQYLNSNTCTNCPTGSFCASPDHPQTACPEGFYQPSQIQQTCLNSNLGFYTTDGVASFSCTAIQYANYLDQCSDCTAGFSCQQSNLPTYCPFGTYSSSTDATCQQCSAGNQCLNRDAQTSCGSGLTTAAGIGVCFECYDYYQCSPTEIFTPCSEGQYISSGGTCANCPQGSLCNSIYKIESSHCLPGYYLTGTQQTNCTRCSEGQQCTNGSTGAVNCTGGNFSQLGLDYCKECGFGLFSSSNTTEDCSPSDANKSNVANNQTACLQGKYSPIGFQECVTVFPGYKLSNTDSGNPFGTDGTSNQNYFTINDSLIILTNQCWRGQQIITGNGHATDFTHCKALPEGLQENLANCPQDQYCPLRNFDAVDCPPGKYSNTQTNLYSQAQCVNCSAGINCYFAYSGSASRVATLSDCIRGAYCIEGTFRPTACQYGYNINSTNNTQKSDCQLCGDNFYCNINTPQKETCGAGYKTLNDAMELCQSVNSGTVFQINSTDVNCQQGFVCPLGTYASDQYPCPPGYYQNQVQQKYFDTCTLCSEGESCDIASTSQGDCATGHYCIKGTKIPQQYKCPSATYNESSTTFTQIDDCQSCPGGKACESGSVSPQTCPQGFICPAGTEFPEQYPCEAGTFNNQTDQQSCQNCPQGSYCPEGAWENILCGLGYYAPNPQQSTCHECPDGSKCTLSETVQTGADTAEGCQLGQYSPLGYEDCLDCITGFYCPSTGTLESAMRSNICPAGAYCVAQGDTPDLDQCGCRYDNNTCPGYCCTAGYYCNAGTLEEYECPIGFFRDTQGATGVSDCNLITAGSIGDEYALSNLSGKECPEGYYCPQGSTYGTPCPEGTYGASNSLESFDECTPCDQGSYCPYSAMKSANQIVCDNGYYCPTGSAAPIPCPIGTFSNTSGLTSVTECTPCTGGKYCDALGLTEVTGDCNAGFFCRLGAYSASPVDGVTGDICSSGGYCPIGSIATQPCTNGQYNNKEGSTSSGDCIECPAGWYCQGSALKEPTGACEGGYYCTGSAATAQQNLADHGYFAPPGSIDQSLCLEGTYSDTAGAQECKPCLAGYFCDETGLKLDNDQKLSKICPIGHYCEEGSVTPTPCPLGTFSDTEGLQNVGQCQQCSAGKYCGTYGRSAVQGNCAAGFFCKQGSQYQYPNIIGNTIDNDFGPCPAGHYCTEDTETPQECNAGTYNPALGQKTQAEGCIKCPAGYFCDQTKMINVPTDNLCREGYYCLEGSNVDNQNQCEIGHRCPTGSPIQLECSPGTYQDQTIQAACKECLVGFYCLFGSHSSDTDDNCQAGDYCKCPAGHFCPQSTGYPTANPCAPGKYNQYTQQIDESACKNCEQGHYCEGPGSTDGQSTACESGYYCTSGSPYLKPLEGSAFGGRCTIGYYCPSQESKDECDKGSYCAQDQLSAIQGKCIAGNFCISGSKRPDGKLSLKDNQCSDSSTCNEETRQCDDGTFCKGGACPTGYYCEEGTTDPVQCPQGKYMPYQGATKLDDCLDCPPGYYCPNEGTVTPTICPEGYYCEGQNVTSGVECDPGFKCPQGSHEMIPCPAGSYQDLSGQSDCKPCTQGYYCEQQASSQTDCPQGYYCLANTGYRFQYPCPIGTYNPNLQGSSPSSCLTCPGGKYCMYPGLNAVSGTCDQGYYCSQGSISNRPINKSTGSICAKGTYCPADSDAQTPCDNGKFCPSQAASLFEGNCLAGFYCKQGTQFGSSVWNPKDGTTGNICGQGSWCSSGSSTESSCPIGTYSPSLGLGAESECYGCPLGYYCDTQGLQEPTGLCEAGYYCTGGSQVSNQNECTAGHMCPEGSMEEIECPPGTYQLNTRQSSCNVCDEGFYCTGGLNREQCPIGYFCPSGTEFGQQYPCPPGTFNDQLQQSECKPCPAGFICPVGSITNTTPCPLYMYCPQNSSVGTFCEPGTYNTENTELQAAEDCIDCPAGKYCVAGRIAGDCTAGYLCTGKSPTPTPNGTNSYGYICPSGKYCVTGTQAAESCPEGTFRTLTGGRQSTDCTVCPPGYYCVTGNPEPIQCPKGHYCEAEVEVPTKCRIRTYSNSLGAFSSNTCTICPGGYLCNEEAIVDYTAYPCQIGHYCVVGAEEYTKCPPGTYGTEVNYSSVDDCITCPGGRKCPGASNTVITCPEGTYCPSGSSGQKACPIGYYCPSGSSNPIISPAGYYSEKYDQNNLDQYDEERAELTEQEYNPIPKQCKLAEYCKEGSFEASVCPPGHYVTSASCKQCPVGYYSTGSLYNEDIPTSSPEDIITDMQRGCLICNPGYICSGGATRPDPTDPELHNGYVCPAGFYCPAGASIPIPCPESTYNPDTQKSSNEACIICPENTYNNRVGQSGCLSCGSYAYSDPGSNTCECTGQFRAYLKTDGTCRCQSGYEFTLDGNVYSNEDSDIDCVKKVFQFCGVSYDRKPNGECMEEDDCDQECNGGDGITLDGVGLCLCDSVKSIDLICNRDCRLNSTKAFLQPDDSIQILDPLTNYKQTIIIENLPNYYGSLECTASTCPIYSCDMLDEGPIAFYGLGTALNDLYTPPQVEEARRLQTSSQGIDNPVACIEKGDTFIFSVNKEHYPIYDKDSLLNNNYQFDYGAFQELERMMKSDATDITIFAFSFIESGIYDITDSFDGNKHLIVSVIGDGEQCPDVDIPLRTRTESALLTLGVQMEEDIIYDPDWIVIFVIFFCMLLLIIGILAAAYFFYRKSWYIPETGKLLYRKKYQKLDLVKLTAVDQPSDNQEHSQSTHKSSDSDTEQNQYDLDISFNDEFDPNLLDNIYDQLRKLNDIAQDGFDKLEEKANEKLSKVSKNIESLKQFIRDIRNNMQDDDDESEESDSLSEDLVENVQEAIFKNLVRGFIHQDQSKVNISDKIGRDQDLDDNDKKELIDDYNANVERILEALESNANQNKDDVNKRLQQRAAERRARRLARGEPSDEMEDDSPSQFGVFNSAGTAILGQQDDSSSSSSKSSSRSSSSNKSSSNSSSSDKSGSKSDSTIEQEIQQEEKKIEQDYEKTLQNKISQLEEEMQNQLKQAHNQDEADRLVQQYRDMQNEIEKDLLAEKLRQQEDLKRRLQERRGKRGRKDQEVVTREEKKKKEDLTDEELQKRLEERKRKRAKKDSGNQYDQQITEEVKKQNEIKEQLKELEQKHMEALSLVDNDEEAKRMLQLHQQQVQALEEQLDSSKKGQEAALSKKLAERRRRRQLKKQEPVVEQLNEEDTFQAKIDRLMDKNLSQQDLQDAIKDLLEEKHDKELAQINSEKKKLLMEQQTLVLQIALDEKARDLKEIRWRFEQREGIDDPQLIKQKMEDARNVADYKFITNLQREQERIEREVEDQFRDRFLELADKQMEELAKIMQKLRQKNPNLVGQSFVQSIMNSYQNQKNQLDDEHQEKMRELDQRRQEIMEQQKEREEEIAQQQRELDEMDKRIKEQAEIEVQREEMKRRQQEIIERMRQTQISEEEMKQMLEKHQQEMNDWEQAMENERKRQRERLELKLEKRMEKHKAKRMEVINQNKRQKEQILQKKKEVKLLKNLNKELKLTDVVRNIDTQLKTKVRPQIQPTNVYLQGDNQQLLDLLMFRVRRIEKIVENLDVVQFQNIANYLENFE